MNQGVPTLKPAAAGAARRVLCLPQVTYAKEQGKENNDRYK